MWGGCGDNGSLEKIKKGTKDSSPLDSGTTRRLLSLFFAGRFLFRGCFLSCAFHRSILPFRSKFSFTTKHCMSLVDSYITSCENECQEKNHFWVIGATFFWTGGSRAGSPARHFFPRECRFKRSSSIQEPEVRRKQNHVPLGFRLPRLLLRIT